MAREHIKELVERLTVVENEIKLLSEDRKELISEYKDKLDVKAFRAAWTIIKRRESVDEAELDNILDTMQKM
jgi:uncharacterized protein (UPF0335 family)